MHINFIINFILSQIFSFKIYTKYGTIAYFIIGCGVMYEIYVVKSGDTLEKIAITYNTDINELIRINGIIDLSNLEEGMQLMVPNNNSNPYRYYTVKKGETLKDISNFFNIDYNLLLQLNGLEIDDYVYPNQTIILPKEGVSLYLTKDNDTVNSILDELGMNVIELMENNNNIYLRENQIIVF